MRRPVHNVNSSQTDPPGGPPPGAVDACKPRTVAPGRPQRVPPVRASRSASASATGRLHASAASRNAGKRGQTCFPVRRGARRNPRQLEFLIAFPRSTARPSFPPHAPPSFPKTNSKCGPQTDQLPSSPSPEDPHPGPTPPVENQRFPTGCYGALHRPRRTGDQQIVLSKRKKVRALPTVKGLDNFSPKKRPFGLTNLFSLLVTCLIPPVPLGAGDSLSFPGPSQRQRC